MKLIVLWWLLSLWVAASVGWGWFFPHVFQWIGQKHVKHFQSVWTLNWNSGVFLQGMAHYVARWRRFFGPNEYSEAPDGGWGWVVGVAFFFVELFTYGTIKSFGIFLQDMIEEFGESNSRVSWIVSVSVFVMTFNGQLMWQRHQSRF